MDSSGPLGQTKALKALQGRASSELRHSPTRPKGGAAPKKRPSQSARSLLILKGQIIFIIIAYGILFGGRGEVANGGVIGSGSADTL